MPITNAVKWLRAQGIAFEVLEYTFAEIGADHAAEAVGRRPSTPSTPTWPDYGFLPGAGVGASHRANNPADYRQEVRRPRRPPPEASRQRRKGLRPENWIIPPRRLTDFLRSMRSRFRRAGNWQGIRAPAV